MVCRSLRAASGACYLTPLMDLGCVWVENSAYLLPESTWGLSFPLNCIISPGKVTSKCQSSSKMAGTGAVCLAALCFLRKMLWVCDVTANYNLTFTRQATWQLPWQCFDMTLGSFWQPIWVTMVLLADQTWKVAQFLSPHAPITCVCLLYTQVVDSVDILSLARQATPSFFNVARE